jgi:hypothetical protein
MPATAADGSVVTVRAEAGDLTRLTDGDLAGTALVTASALLDMLTAEEVDRIVAACVGAGSRTLFLISVTGGVRLTPSDPLDDEVAAAFNAHQRRAVAGRHLLGPDAVQACTAAFARHGVPVRVQPSPWRLGPDEADLAGEWFAGWLDAARDHRPELTDRTEEYARRRREEARTGRLGVQVDHVDLLALCH